MRTIADAIAHIHAHAGRMADVVDRLEQLLGGGPEPADMRRQIINPGNNGVYTVTERSQGWVAASYAVLNLSTDAAVYLGIGGTDPLDGSNPYCPAATASVPGLIVLPVRVNDIVLGCQGAALAANSAVVFTFRFRTVQALRLVG